VIQAPAQIKAVEFAVHDARYPDLLRAHDYWRRKRMGRFAPRRSDIDPSELIEVLPRVMLVDVQREPLDFRYRLSGTGICDVHGSDLTGRRPRELLPAAYGALVERHYRECVARRSPLLHLVMLDSAEKLRSYARLLLPLSEDGEAVTMLLAIDSKEQNTRALHEYFRTVAGSAAA
jgi:hypothetical protein